MGFSHTVQGKQTHTFVLNLDKKITGTSAFYILTKMVNKHLLGYGAFGVVALGLAIALIATNVDAGAAPKDGPVCCTSGSFETNSCSADINSLANGWNYDDNEKALTKTFQVANFKSAFAWMTAVGMEAEAIQHHPEWFNVYSTIDVKWTTHDCPNGGDLSNFDIQMAQYCDQVYVSPP